MFCRIHPAARAASGPPDDRPLILSDRDISESLSSGKLVIDPIGDGQIQPASVDLRLGSHYLKLDEHKMESITMDTPPAYVDLFSEEIVMPPHSFLLATTMEFIRLPNDLTAFVEGRSSIGRLGLFIQNAGWVDPGFEGTLTLELYNANRLPLKFSAGRRICQLVLARLSTPCKNAYHGKYQSQRGTVGSRIFQDRGSP